MDTYNIQPKIIDLMLQYSNEVTEKKYMSVEVSPGFSNLNFEEVLPLFYSVVWKTPKDMCLLTVNEDNVDCIPAMKLAQILRGDSKVVMVHITCVDMSYRTLNIILKKLQSLDIKNILALQGDGIESSTCDDLQHASDIVEYARKMFGNYFSIGVVGDPNYDYDIDYFKYLKKKINFGADFIITQIIYESIIFEKFVDQCKNLNIDVPIIPSLYICDSYDSLQRMVKITGVDLSSLLSSQIEKVRSNNSEIINIMNTFMSKLAKELKNNKCIYIHWCAVKNLEDLALQWE